MARPQKPLTEQRTLLLSFRVTPEEAIQIKKNAQNYALTTSDYVRKVALESSVRVISTRAYPFDLTEQIRRMGVNLNQYTKLARQIGEVFPPEFVDLCAQVNAYLDRELSEP